MQDEIPQNPSMGHEVITLDVSTLVARIPQLAEREVACLDLVGRGEIPPEIAALKDALKALATPDDVTDLTPLAALTNLEWLDLMFCPKLADLSPLAELPKLAWLKLAKCETLTDLTPLAQLTNLRVLNLRNCPAVTDLSPLSGLAELVHLDLSGCEGVTDLGHLKGHPRLEMLDISDCHHLADPAPLADLQGLKSLTAFETNLDDEAIQFLTEQLPDCEILSQ